MIIDLKGSIDLRWLFDTVLLFILRWSCFNSTRCYKGQALTSRTRPNWSNWWRCWRRTPTRRSVSWCGLLILTGKRFEEYPLIYHDVRKLNRGRNGKFISLEDNSDADFLPWQVEIWNSTSVAFPQFVWDILSWSSLKRDCLHSTICTMNIWV